MLNIIRKIYIKTTMRYHYTSTKVTKVKVGQWCPTLCDSMDYIVHGILQARKLEWVAEKEMATHSSVLAWRIPGTGEPGGLPSMGSHRVGHD